jgi:hypothetical protein
MLVAAFVLVRGLQTADAQWTGSAVPAATSLASAPVLDKQMRVRGHLGPGQTLYLKVDPAARGSLDYAIDAVGPFAVDAVLTNGKRVTVVDPVAGVSGPELSQPDWLLARQSWGHGGDVGDIAVFAIRSVPGKNVGASYQFTLFNGPDGYSP